MQPKPRNDMHKSMAFGITVGALLAAGLFVTTTPVLAGLVTGQNGVVLSVYANPFDPNNDGVVSGTEATMTVGAIGSGTVGIAAGYSLQNLVNRHDGYNDNYGARMTDASGLASNGFMQFQAASSFQAGTVIASQFTFVQFPVSTPYTVKLDGTAVQSGPGIPGTTPIQVTTLPRFITGSQLRVEEGMSTYGATGPTYGLMNEVMILPQRLNLVAATVTQTAGTAWFGAPQAVSDLDGYGWGGRNNPSLKLTFAAPTLVSALVVANFDASSQPNPVNFNIKNDVGTVIGNVQLVGTTYGEFIPINFVTPVTTSFLTFDFTDVGGSGFSAMREIMVFSDVPEPSTALLFGLSGLLLLRKMRKP